MGTEKRARQKANRAAKLEQLYKEERTEKRKRRFLRWGILAVVAVGGLILLSFVLGDDSDETADAGATTTVAAASTVPGETTVAGATTVPGETTVAAATTAAPPETVPGGSITGETPCPPAEGAEERITQFEQAPPMCIDESKTYTATISYQDRGDLVVTLDAAKAPTTVNNFVVLARYGYFDGTVCHRAIPGFVVQCGDPTATGSGGPGYEFADELPAEGEYQVGSLAMANSGPDTNGSQFFLITGPDGASLPPNYSLFGQAEPGQEELIAALDALGNPDPSANGVPPLEQIVIESVTVTES